jgi:hypothetical protein
MLPVPPDASPIHICRDVDTIGVNNLLFPARLIDNPSLIELIPFLLILYMTLATWSMKV